MKVAVTLICKNEQLDIANCLNSIKDYVDEIIIADTGSTDNTLNVIGDCLKDFKGNAKVISSDVGMENGKIVSFADARNNVVDLVSSDVDYIISLDADDVFVNPEKLRENLVADVVWSKMFGHDRLHQFNTLRIWKNGLGIKWFGNVHEYLVVPPNTKAHYSNLEIMHRYGDAPGQEGGTERNLRIMKKEIDEGKAGSRTYFYYANQLRESGKLLEAIEYYNKYFPISYYHDEVCLAYLYRARCFRLLMDYRTAAKACFEGLAFDTKFAELWMELAFNYYELKDYKKCIAICDIAMTIPVPSTNLFVEVDKYTTQPHITKKFALEKLSIKTT